MWTYLTDKASEARALRNRSLRALLRLKALCCESGLIPHLQKIARFRWRQVSVATLPVDHECFSNYRTKMMRSHHILLHVLQWAAHNTDAANSPRRSKSDRQQPGHRESNRWQEK